MKQLVFFFFLLTMVFSISVEAQIQLSKPKPAPTPPVVKIKQPPAPYKLTIAYAELLAEKIEAEADLRVLLADYNEEAPQVRDMQIKVKWLELAIKKLESMPAEALTDLTPAMSKMLARRIEAEAEVFILREVYTDEHPLVKKAKIRLSVLESELKKVLL